MNLTKIGKALVVTLLFRLLFGGYLIGMDQYRFNDVESALTVLLIYGLIGIFATLFISGIRYGLLGLIGLDSIFITLQIAFTILSLSKIVYPGLHDPLVNWWATMLMCQFSLLTLIFSFSANREINISLAHNIKSTINS
jgi:putative exporter of polyketide antibiotics